MAVFYPRLAGLVQVGQPVHMTRLVVIILLFCADSLQAATIIYLHGKIIEEQGDNAVHPQYGTYEYGKIVSAFKEAGHLVISEVRSPDTDRAEYAAGVVSTIETMLKSGTPPRDIVVIGFSKGAQIAILVSQQLENRELRFVLQAVCGSWVRHFENLKVYGDILSMYETSDSAGSCAGLFRRSKPSTCEIPISTGLRHGAFYRPLDAWLLPQMQWISSGKCASRTDSHN